MIEFTNVIQAQFDKMSASGKLFRSKITGQQVWDLYLSSFTQEDDPIFRDPNSSVHNCNFCKNFIRRYGNIVSIDENYNIITLFDVDAPDEYKNSAKAISQLLKNNEIVDVFFETFSELNSLPYESCNKNNLNFKLGISQNVKRYTKEEAGKFGIVKADEIRTFNHFYLQLDRRFVDTSGKSIEAITANYRDAKLVFQRAMNELHIDTLNLVKDLINQDSLLDGKTHLYKVQAFITFKEEYEKIPFDKRDTWCWNTSYELGIAKFKNELIGVLCTELSEGKELNEACIAWNKRVDPINYLKATTPITERQKQEARRFVEENGYLESFNRRFATIDDIKASEIKHINVGSTEIKSVSIFDDIKTTSTRHKRSEFDGVEEVSIEKFLQDIVPTCTSVEAFLVNNHEGNLVALTTSNIKDSKPIFKWNNNYSWTFNGNIAGKSQIKDAVKSRGGQIDAVVRISMFFPNTTDDYDLHCVTPTKEHIDFRTVRKLHYSSGSLDLDAQGVDGYQVPEKRVENITFTNKSVMPKGNYSIWVQNYSRRGLTSKFLIEIEIEGEITTLELETPTIENELPIATIAFDGHRFIINPSSSMRTISSSSITKTIWGLKTNEFHKVNLICLSPNYWGYNTVGNKHYMFMLQDCKSTTPIRGFHIENLISDLVQHRKVLDTLGNITMIEPTDKQLSGIGFNATVRDELIVRLQGTFKRVIKIKF